MIIRVDRDEEILAKLKEVALDKQVHAAAVNAIGAVGEFTIGVFKTAEKQFLSKTYRGAFEMVSLLGTIGTLDGEFTCHLHMCAADESGIAVGGHLTRAVVSATAEIVLYLLDGTLERSYDSETGLNLLDFEK